MAQQIVRILPTTFCQSSDSTYANVFTNVDSDTSYMANVDSETLLTVGGFNLGDIYLDMG